MPSEVMSVLQRADRLFDQAEVEGALDRMAGRITDRLRDANPLVVCVLMGGLVPFGRLLGRFDFPLEVDYVHATRYRNALQGSELRWLAGPVVSPAGRTVLIVDDILDEGETLAAIDRRFRKAGAARVLKSVLVSKRRARSVDVKPEFVGLEVPDRYVFGYGMDYKGYWRNLPAIYALADES